MNKNLVLVLIIIINSCSYPEILFDELIYSNNFEENTKNIDGGNIVSFNNTKVLGNYNNDGFIVHLDQIQDHDYIFISFDLYIHGSWDGNKNGFDVGDKPDKWIIEVDPEMDLHLISLIVNLKLLFQIVCVFKLLLNAIISKPFSL